MQFVRADVLRNVHGRLIETYGGLGGVRDENGLESAIARPKHLQHYTGEGRIGVLAATLAWALLRNHPFADGNKRAALAALVMALDLNGYRLLCSEVEETGTVMRAAAQAITEDEWIAWGEQSIAPADAPVS